MVSWVFLKNGAPLMGPNVTKPTSIKLALMNFDDETASAGKVTQLVVRLCTRVLKNYQSEGKVCVNGSFNQMGFFLAVTAGLVYS